MYEVTDHRGRYFKTKKALKEAPVVSLSNTSMFGGFSGWASDAPDGTYIVVGPTAYLRRWYATVTVKDGKVKVS
jgi:hypothetical protein